MSDWDRMKAVAAQEGWSSFQLDARYGAQHTHIFHHRQRAGVLQVSHDEAGALTDIYHLSRVGGGNSSHLSGVEAIERILKGDNE